MSEKATSVQGLAQQAINALDALLERLEGGEGLRVLIDARGALSVYVQRGAMQTDKELTVKASPVGGVTLVRSGQHFTINDEELELVREAVNVRKRELRKRERREAKAARPLPRRR